MTIFLDIMILVTLLGALGFMAGARKPSGPEGPVGAWLLVMLVCLLLATVVFVLAGRDMIGALPGGRAVQFLAAGGAVVALGVWLLGALGPPEPLIAGVLVAAVCLVHAACAAAVHQADLPWPRAAAWASAGVLAGAALFGWGVVAVAIVQSWRKSMREQEAKARRDREQEQHNRQEEIARFEQTAEGASLAVLLSFMFARNEQIRQVTRERMAALPDLAEALGELLDQKSDDAVDYIAKVYDAPPKELGPAYVRMLERKRKAWNSLQFDENAGTWEMNLRCYFTGAKKIQQAGFDLRPQLQDWHEHLLKCKGLDGLAAFVESLL